MRCFVALPLTNDLRDLLADHFYGSEYPRNIRAIDERLWHVTLAFLGDIDPTKISHIIKTLKRFDERPGEIFFTHLSSFPCADPCLLVASGFANPNERWTTHVNDLRNAMSEYSAERNEAPWLPHVTIARTHREQNVVTWKHDIQPICWAPKSFSLMKSESTHAGSLYNTIHEFPFTR